MIRLPSALNEVLQQGGTVVVPSRQRAHAARLGHSAAALSSGRRVWETPDILPVETWLARELERYAAAGDADFPRLLSPAEDWLLWRQCTADATRDLELVNRGALAEGLRRASALAADFRIELLRGKALAPQRHSREAFQGAPGAESALLVEVQRAVLERCRDLGAASAASLLTRAPCVGDQRAVLFSGFLKLSPRLEAIGAARRARGYGAGQAVPDRRSAQTVAIAAADELEELQRIAQWCRARLASNPEARMLVVLPGGPGTRERLATLIRQATDPRGWLQTPQHPSSSDSLVVIEGGSPLGRVPAVAHALRTLEWLAGNSVEFAAVSEWLRAPYWTTPKVGARTRLDLWLRSRGRMQFNLQQFVSALEAAPAPVAQSARELATQIRRAVQLLGQGAASPRDWSERFRAVLDATQWPGDRTRSSDDQQTVVRLHELLDEFGQLASTVRSISRDEALQWLHELANRTAFRPADDDAAVTISPTLADPVVGYDGIWVAGLHADVFPQPVQPDPFLPLAAQLAAGIPAATASGRLAEAQSLVAAWRAATDELVLSTPVRSEDLELLPSPLLAQWMVKPSTPVPAARHKPPATSQSTGANERSVSLPGPARWLPALIRREGMLESLDDASGTVWSPDLPLPAGTRSLELQNQCPFRAYAELRLGSGELDAPEPGVAPDMRGQLLHMALQRLWLQLRESRALSGISETALDELIAASVQHAAAELWQRVPEMGDREGSARGPVGADTVQAIGGSGMPPAFARECRRAVRLIRRLCDLERERPSFRVQETEADMELKVAGAQLRMRIDRVDQLESGGRAILDYKSGRRVAADWYGERPSHPQLLAYLAALGEDVLAMATVNVTAREVRFEGIASTPELLPKVKPVKAPDGTSGIDAWAVRQREWRMRIEKLASDFLAGSAVVDPKPGACDYCHVTNVCRIADRTLEVGAEADADEQDSGSVGSDSWGGP